MCLGRFPRFVFPMNNFIALFIFIIFIESFFFYELIVFKCFLTEFCNMTFSLWIFSCNVSISFRSWHVMIVPVLIHFCLCENWHHQCWSLSGWAERFSMCICSECALHLRCCGPPVFTSLPLIFFPVSLCSFEVKWSESHSVVSHSLLDTMDYTVHGILQARILEWVAFPFSRGSSPHRNWTRVSCVAGRYFTNWAMREAVTFILLVSMWL